MHDLRGNYILSLTEPRTTSHGLSSFPYLSAKFRNALPDFITAFLFNKYISKHCVFRYVPVYAMYFSCKCNASKILALVVILKFEIK